MPVWLLGMSRFSKEEDRMAKIMLVMTHEEVDTNIAYSLICFSRYGSAWDTGRRRRAWQLDFTEDEKKAAGRLFRQSFEWTCGRGLSGTIRMTMNTFNLWRKLGEFCASV